MTDTADAVPVDDTDDRNDQAADTERSGPVPEFRIVVRNADRRGPLAPYRLLVAVGIVLVVFGPALWSSLADGAPDDVLLLKAAAIGLVVWITTGIVSRALADASARADADSA